jgi:hypothetical protein
MGELGIGAASIQKVVDEAARVPGEIRGPTAHALCHSLSHLGTRICSQSIKDFSTDGKQLSAGRGRRDTVGVDRAELPETADAVADGGFAASTIVDSPDQRRQQP